MPLRLLRYVVRIWDRWRDEHPGARRLPPVIPVVLFHGPRGWSAPTRLIELVDIEPRLLEPLGRFIPSFELVLDDLSRRSDEELRLEALSRLTLLLFKHLHDERLEELLPRWAEAFRELARPDATGLQGLCTVIEYMLQVSDLSEAVLGDFLASEVSAEAEGIAMTTAERLRREGHQRGLEEGLEQGLKRGLEQGLERGLERGLEQGRAAGLRGILSRQLTQRFGPLNAKLRARLSSATIGELEAWADRVLTATSPEEVLSSR
jgi:hypothetical protein